MKRITNDMLFLVSQGVSLMVDAVKRDCKDSHGMKANF